ncbi:MAG: DUF3307 domain-containing protein [Pseudomonadota bacterium]
MQEIFLLLVALQIKHFVADYLLQNNWMISGKQSLLALGGYAHAGVHVIGTWIILVFFAVPLSFAISIVIAEFFIHYALDYAKVRLDRVTSGEKNQRVFWAKHGLDQLLHHLTYVGIAYLAFQFLPLILGS